MPHKCVIKLGQHWFRSGLVTWSAPSHYLSQYWLIVNCAFRNILQWNSNQNTKFFIHKNASKNIVCEIAAILSRGKWVNDGIMFLEKSTGNLVAFFSISTCRWTGADRHQGWGLLNQCPPFRYYLKFSASSKHTLAIEYHVYIWQVSPQLSCGGTCQI